MKVRTNVTVNQDLFEIAKKLNIQLSAVLDEALRMRIKEKLADSWLEENREAIAAYNADIETNDVFSRMDRSF
ncbi:MAG: type II toxin-antitoxin system CcdA family antitoxin [Spirochaetia bacterium]|jgi:antitoxin CcdA|nr:type II toxin-antitoxin system CcdA family antitoxin [Spirochaetia bacterium]